MEQHSQYVKETKGRFLLGVHCAAAVCMLTLSCDLQLILKTKEQRRQKNRIIVASRNHVHKGD